jgi:hypothetical protein
MVAVIGLFDPLKTVLDAITKNRDINRQRDEARRSDERKRERQAMRHEEAMAREGREDEQLKLAHELAVARLRIEAETIRHDAMMDLFDRLATDRQSVAAEELLRQFMPATEGAANDAPVNGATMLEQAGNSAELGAADAAMEQNDVDVTRQHSQERARPASCLREGEAAGSRCG